MWELKRFKYCEDRDGRPKILQMIIREFLFERRVTATSVIASKRRRLYWRDGLSMPPIRTTAIYKKGVLVLDGPVHIPENARVEVLIREKFSAFVKKFGEPEAEGDVDALLMMNRRPPLGR